MRTTAIVLFVTILALWGVREYVLEPYSVPFEGMEPTLTDGDRIVVYKWNYGSSSSVQLGDVSVFHDPSELGVDIDKRKLFIARVVGMPGDTMMLNLDLMPTDASIVSLKQKRVYHYPAMCEERMLAIIDSLRIPDSFVGNGASSHSRQFTYSEIVKIRKAIGNSFTLICTTPDVPSGCYPYVVPKKGSPIDVMPWNITLLCNTINCHEQHKAAVRGDELIVDGAPVKNYVFTHDYYWVMCDNTLNLNDSRLFGFVPNDHFVGKMVLKY